MSTKFLILPTISSEWTAIDEQFHVDLHDFEQHLRQYWTIIIPMPPESCNHDFEWRFTEDGSTWQIYYDRRIIRFRWDDYAISFILWYRTYIPLEQRLFLVFEGGGYLAITADTTAQQLTAFGHSPSPAAR